MPTLSTTTKNTLLFLFLNFFGLALGGLMMGEGPGGDWYQNLNRAPWTPPAWVFGAAWFTLMACFAVFMAVAVDRVPKRQELLVVYGVLWLTNLAWNPIFFNWQLPWWGLVDIVAMTLLVAYLAFAYGRYLGMRVLWAMPYLIWISTATSLNAYVCFNNSF